jgi:hypothetical protein
MTGHFYADDHPYWTLDSNGRAVYHVITTAVSSTVERLGILAEYQRHGADADTVAAVRAAVTWSVERERH